jgi:hypothetical protein
LRHSLSGQTLAENWSNQTPRAARQPCNGVRPARASRRRLPGGGNERPEDTPVAPRLRPYIGTPPAGRAARARGERGEPAAARRTAGTASCGGGVIERHFI